MELYLKNLLLALLMTLLLWTSSFTHTSARRGKHSIAIWASSYKKQLKPANHGSKNYNNNHDSHHLGKPVKLKPPHYMTPSQPRLAPAAAPVPPPEPLVPSSSVPSTGSYKDSLSVFNVLDFGATGDGLQDDTKAFEAAWASACKMEGSTMLIPSSYQFNIGPISFSGPYCQQNILVQLDGTIVAPTSPNTWGSFGALSWIEFTKLKRITIQGTGTIDGSGSIWWQDFTNDSQPNELSRLIVPSKNTTLEKPPMQVRSELSQKMPRIKPTALRFSGSFNVTVLGITIQNSPQFHLKFDSCIGVSVHGINVSSPGDSPNTDGIHLQNSKDVLIHSSNIACGDDCVSIQSGSSNVYIHNINCGPGHGISIGSLGKDNTRACVSNITVRDVTMHNTMTGVRIKTWQGGMGSVQGILFSNIQVSEVQLPIVIDQFYCDKSSCRNESSSIGVSGVTYERIRGTYTVKPVHFACSDNLPCTDVILTAIQLKPLQERYRLYDPFCWQAFGELNAPTVPPIGCLQFGKPARSHLQLELDLC